MDGNSVAVNRETSLQDMYNALFSDDDDTSFGNFSFSDDNVMVDTSIEMDNVTHDNLNQPASTGVVDNGSMSVSTPEKEATIGIAIDHPSIKPSLSLGGESDDSDEPVKKPELDSSDDNASDHNEPTHVIKDDELHPTLGIKEGISFQPNVDYVINVVDEPEKHITHPETDDKPGASVPDVVAININGNVEPKKNTILFDMESKPKLVNGVEISTQNSITESTASDSDPEDANVIENPNAADDGKLSKAPTDFTLAIETATYDNNINSNHTYDAYVKSNNPDKGSHGMTTKSIHGMMTTSRCIILIACFFVIAFVAFIISLANTGKCSCDDINTLRSQLALLMSERNCPSGWRSYEGSCYGIASVSKMSFTNAKDACGQYGAHLVNLETKGEVNFFTKQILCPRFSTLGRDDKIRVGLKKVGNAYKWTSGIEFKSQNTVNTTASNGACVQINKSGSWTASECTTKFNFYCEVKSQKGSSSTC